MYIIVIKLRVGHITIIKLMYGVLLQLFQFVKVQLLFIKTIKCSQKFVLYVTVPGATL